MRARAIAALLTIGAATFFGGALAPLGSDRPVAAPVGTTIEALESRLDRDPADADLHTQLGFAYLGRARDEADPSALLPAEQAFRRALELAPRGDHETFTGMAALANARHDFSGSVTWSRRAIAANPHDAAAYGLLGDSLFELGRVGAADGAYQEMVDRRPDVASYVRASYSLQYHGRTRAAIGVMRLALQAAGPTGETAAWVRHQIGDIYAGLGKFEEAARQNRIGIEIAPGYAPPAVGLAESLIARGRLERALKLVETAVARLPSLEYMITLGDLYRATGRLDDARRQYTGAADKLADYRRAGVLPDADFIVFYADHGLRPHAALREAFAIHRDRPTPKTADALAWMLHSLGRDEIAWRHARTATRRPADATALLHAGTIALSAGRDAVGARLVRRALDLDPTLSALQAPPPGGPRDDS